MTNDDLAFIAPASFPLRHSPIAIRTSPRSSAGNP